MKKILILTIPLMLLFAPPVFACNPLPDFPPGANVEWGNYVGPDITGTLTFTRTETGVDIRLVGSCKNIPLDNTVSIGIDFFDCVSSEYLLGTCEAICGCTGLPEMLPDSLVPYDCYPDKKSVYFPVIYNVIRDYGQDGNSKSFKILGLFPTIKPIKK